MNTQNDIIEKILTLPLEMRLEIIGEVFEKSAPRLSGDTHTDWFKKQSQKTYKRLQKLNCKGVTNKKQGGAA